MGKPKPGPRAGFSLPLLPLLLIAIGLLAWGIGWWVLLVALALGLLATVGVAVHDHFRPPPYDDEDEWTAPGSASAVSSAARPRPETVPSTGPTPTYGEPSATGLVTSSLASAVQFIGECLENDDHQRLSAACEGDGSDRDALTRLAYDWLRENHTSNSLKEIYRGQRFPDRAGEFKLGGHDRELGHVHIDFVSGDGVLWRLSKIWMCR